MSSRIIFGVRNVAGTMPKSAILSAFSIGHNLLWSADIPLLKMIEAFSLLARGSAFLRLWARNCEKAFLEFSVLVDLKSCGKAVIIDYVIYRIAVKYC